MCESIVYALDDNNNVVPCTGGEYILSSLKDTARRKVAFTRFKNGTTACTVFVGITNCVKEVEGHLGLFETIVRHMKEGKEVGQDCFRCDDWDEALEQHAVVVDELLTQEPSKGT